MTALYVGLDVHKATIAVAVAEEGRRGEVWSWGTIDNNPAQVDRLMKRLAKSGKELLFCYEAGCCGNLTGHNFLKQPFHQYLHIENKLIFPFVGQRWVINQMAILCRIIL